MHEHMYTCIHVYIYTYVHMYTDTHMHICICTYIQKCVYAYIRIITCSCIHTCMLLFTDVILVVCLFFGNLVSCSFRYYVLFYLLVSLFRSRCLGLLDLVWLVHSIFVRVLYGAVADGSGPLVERFGL